MLKGRRNWDSGRSKGKGGKGDYSTPYGLGLDTDGRLPYGYGYDNIEEAPYGYEYGPDGYLRPRCPPGFVYPDLLDVLEEVEFPDRPGLDDGEATDEPGPEPATTAPGPEPATTAPAPEPATTAPAPEPATTAPAPEPATPAPEPATPAPSAAAGSTPAPSAAGATTAPSAATASETTTAPSGPTDSTTGPTSAMDPQKVIVEDSFLDYGFFQGTTVREPTQEEIDGIIIETNRFFTDVFSAAYGADFVSFSADNSVMSFMGEGDTYPVRIDFDAAVTFAEGATPATRDEIFTAMQNSDLNVYIQMYAWEAAPVMASLFYDTQRVKYDARISSTGT